MAKDDNITEIGQAYHSLYHNIAVRREHGYGVVSGCEVTTTNSLSVDIASGTIFHNGISYDISAETLSLQGADPNDPRKDIVVFDGSNLSVIAGTPNPKASDQSSATRFQTYQPAPPDGTGRDYTVLAELWVAAGTLSLSSNDINDLRTDPVVHADVVDAVNRLGLPVYADNANAVVSDAEMWFNDGSGPDSAGVYYYDGGVQGPLESGSGSAPGKLSGLTIDTDKDWGGYDITNLGTVGADVVQTDEILTSKVATDTGRDVSVTYADSVFSGGSEVIFDISALQIGEPIGFLIVTKDRNAAGSGYFNLQGPAKSVTEVSDPSNQFSTSSGTNNSVNVFWSGSAYVIENNDPSQVITYRFFGTFS